MTDRVAASLYDEIMTSVGKAPAVTFALLLLAAGALAGCAPEPSSSTPTPAVEQTPATPDPSPTADPTPTQTPTKAPETPSAFTESELVQICIDATNSGYDGVEFDAAGARIEKRTVTPEWLVLVPAQTNGYDAESACTIGGSPTDPDIELSSASIQPLSEEQIQKLIRGEDEGGTD